MTSSGISTFSLNAAIRHSVQRAESALVPAQKEVATGRLADVGRALGHRTAATVSLRSEHARLSTFTNTNAVVRTRLQSTQIALDGVRTTAENLLGALVSVRDGTAMAGTLRQQADSALSSLVSTLNGSGGGQHLFGGIATDRAPLAEYRANPASAAKQSVDAAFRAAFGMGQDDPGVGAIDGAAMSAFLDGAFAALFDDAGWSADWSTASSQPIRSRIAPGETIESSVSANDPAVRKLAAAYTMVADLGTADLNPAAFRAVADKAVALLGEAVTAVTALQAQTGEAEARLGRADARLSLQVDMVATRISGLEGVDPFEAATRATTLLTQVELSYALTSRIQRLSILNFL